MGHRKDASILIWSDGLRDRHRVSWELWAIGTRSVGLWACAVFVALSHLCSDCGGISSLQHCRVATVAARVTSSACLPLLAHHPLHGLHATCSLQMLVYHLSAFMTAAAAAPSDGCPPLSPPMWWHCVPLDWSWAGRGTGITSYPVWHTHLHFLFVAVCERQIHIEKSHSRNAVDCGPKSSREDRV